MTLPVSGAISINAINVELGVAGTTTASLGQASFRTLAGVPSGAISMSNFYGKSNRKTLSYVFSANTANASLNIAAISGYVAGVSDVTVTVNSGVWLYATSTANAGLTLTGGTTGDTLKLINNGNIIGMGGSGGICASSSPPTTGQAGGTALSLGFNTSITNNSYIAGGGGGGTSWNNGAGDWGFTGGGGGAGGGQGGYNTATAGSSNNGGGIGASGTAGSEYGSGYPASPGGGAGGAGAFSTSGYGPLQGGGGGRILPGTGGVAYNSGANSLSGGNGGSAGNAGLDCSGLDGYRYGGGGGGGWGAVGGGTGSTVTGTGFLGGGAGGKCVALNGRTVTWNVNGTRYGAIS